MRKPFTVEDGFRHLWKDKWRVLAIALVSCAADNLSWLLGWAVIIAGTFWLVVRFNREWARRPPCRTKTGK